MNGEESVQNGFKERYAEFLSAFNLTPKSLADSLGDKGHVKYNNWKTGEAKPNSESLAQIASKYPISIDWLVLGIGTMERDSTQKASSAGGATTNKMPIEHQMDLVIKENQMLRAENTKLWRLTLPEAAQRELDFLRASSQTTAIGFQQQHQLRIKGTDYTKLDRPMIIPDIRKGWPCRLSKP